MTQSSKTINERIQLGNHRNTRLIRDYSEQKLHAKELDILKEINKFLEAHSLHKAEL